MAEKKKQNNLHFNIMCGYRFELCLIIIATNLKPCSCATFAPGCIFAPQVSICTPLYFMPCKQCFKKIQPGAKIRPGANLPLLSRWCKLKLRPGVFLHPGVFCAYGRKTLYRYAFLCV